MCSAPRVMAWSRNALNLISALHSTSGLGVRPAEYSRRNSAKTRSLYSAAKLTYSNSTPTRSATLAASSRSWRVEQYSESSSSSQFFMNRPMTSEPCCLTSQAETDESTPPDMPTTTRRPLPEIGVSVASDMAAILERGGPDRSGRFRRTRLGCRRHLHQPAAKCLQDRQIGLLLGVTQVIALSGAYRQSQRHRQLAVAQLVFDEAARNQRNTEAGGRGLRQQGILVETCALERAARVAAGLLEPIAPAFQCGRVVQQRVAQQFVGLLTAVGNQARAAYGHDIPAHDVIGPAARPYAVAEPYGRVQLMIGKVVTQAMRQEL